MYGLEALSFNIKDGYLGKLVQTIQSGTITLDSNRVSKLSVRLQRLSSGDISQVFSQQETTTTSASVKA